MTEIKGTVSPVFASKFCHFLAPAIFPVVDNEAMGNRLLTYEACFLVYQREWRLTNEATRMQLASRLEALIAAPLVSNYPLTNKVIEVCLIGRHQGWGMYRHVNTPSLRPTSHLPPVEADTERDRRD